MRIKVQNGRLPAERLFEFEFSDSRSLAKLEMAPGVLSPSWLSVDVLLDRAEWLAELACARSTIAKRQYETTGKLSLGLGRRYSDLTHLPSLGDFLTPYVSVFPKRPCTLYPYQDAGVSWLVEHKRGILADDMGLGKTVQVVVAIAELISGHQEANVRVICPKSLVPNWIVEINKWAPWLVVSDTSTGASRQHESLSHVHVENYESFTDQEALDSQSGILVTDESHRLRKASSAVMRRFSQCGPSYWWMLTGTPMEHGPQDLQVLLSLLLPSRFRSHDEVTTESDIRIKSEPYFLRRTKCQALLDLPPMHEEIEPLAMTPLQRESYRKVRDGVDGRGGNALARLGKLLEICDFDEQTNESPKLDRAMELIDEAIARDEKIIVFSYTLQPLMQLSKRLKAAGIGGATTLIDGALSTAERKRTSSQFQNEGKIKVLLASLRAAGEGLTLTAANNVVFINRWWNPSLNDQGRDRIHRIGQVLPCKATYLSMKDTAEERLNELLISKSDSIGKVIGTLKSYMSTKQGASLLEEIMS